MEKKIENPNPKDLVEMIPNVCLDSQDVFKRIVEAYVQGKKEVIYPVDCHTLCKLLLMGYKVHYDISYNHINPSPNTRYKISWEESYGM